MGDRYVRHLLVTGATAVVRYTRRKTTTVSLWANRLLERKPARLVTVAVANKMARIIWAVMARDENHRTSSGCRLRAAGKPNFTVWAGENDERDADRSSRERDNLRDLTRIERDSLMRTRSTDPIMASGLVPRATGRTHECT